MSDTHEQFLENLRVSEETRWLVAMWLSGWRGFAVTVPPTRFARTQDKWREYADDGDLCVQWRVEVKQLSYNFTNRQDWPFKQKFLVGSKNAFDRAHPKPYAYISINPQKTHAAFLLCSTYKSWWVEKKRDSRYDKCQEAYVAPTSVVSFAPLEWGITDQDPVIEEGLDPAK